MPRSANVCFLTAAAAPSATPATMEITNANVP